MRRHHVDESSVQKAVEAVVRAASIITPASWHTLRHSLVTHLLECRAMQEQLGHADVRTTQIHIRVVQRGGRAVHSLRGAVLARGTG